MPEETLEGQSVSKISRHLMIRIAAPIVAKLSIEAVDSLFVEYTEPKLNTQPGEENMHAVTYHFLFGDMRPSHRIVGENIDEVANLFHDTLQTTVERISEGNSDI